MIRDIKEPAGLDSVKCTVKNICSEAAKYRFRHPASMIIYLNEKQGRSTVAEYITDMFFVHKVMDFSMSRSEFIELDFNGEYKQFNDCMKQVNDAADYTNDDKYSNVLVETGINNLSKHLGEQHVDDYLNHVETMSKTAVLVIFVSENPNSKESQLIDRIKEVLPFANIIKPREYSVEDYCKVIKEKLCDYGVIVPKNTPLNEVVKKSMNKDKSFNMKGACLIAEELFLGSKLVNGKLKVDVSAINSPKTDRVIGGKA